MNTNPSRGGKAFTSPGVMCSNGFKKSYAPDLKIILSHFAGCSGPQAEYEERIKIVADSPNVYIDSGGFTFRQRHPFLKAQEILEAAVAAVGADKIAWGTDYPRPGLVVDASYKQQLEFITVQCDFLSEEQRQQLLSGTALRVYKWDNDT